MNEETTASGKSCSSRSVKDLDFASDSRFLAALGLLLLPSGFQLNCMLRVRIAMWLESDYHRVAGRRSKIRGKFFESLAALARVHLLAQLGTQERKE